MRRASHITPLERQKILSLSADGLSFPRIAKLTNFSVKTCWNGVNHVNKHRTTSNIAINKTRKTTSRDDRVIHRLSEADRHKTAVDIHKEILPVLSVPISVKTVQKRLNEFELMERIARKKPFI